MVFTVSELVACSRMRRRGTARCGSLAGDGRGVVVSFGSFFFKPSEIPKTVGFNTKTVVFSMIGECPHFRKPFK
jgi:hypothetical protein